MKEIIIDIGCTQYTSKKQKNSKLVTEWKYYYDTRISLLKLC